MKITAVETRFEDLELVRPYVIAFRRIESAENGIVAVRTGDGRVGLGAAAPEPFVTGEDRERCAGALDPGELGWLVGEDVRELPRLCRELRRRAPGAPAARAAVDMALHDLLGQCLGLPLADLLGRAHERLPTSVTIGILPVEEAVAEAADHAGRGFRVLKVKLGHDVEEDVERIARIRERVGAGVAIRVDPNQGYDAAALARFAAGTASCGVEFIEQPLPADAVAELRALDTDLRRRIAADEMLLDDADALALAAPEPACGIFNIKLMKCGGIDTARRIATIAEIAGIELMWGCMDESRISITAALHAALASPATRYLDLDGSLDLARDVAEGGFVLEDGCLRTGAGAGLGLRPI